MLSLERVRLDLREFRLAADLEVAGGARVAVLGPSGAGKSTFLGAIAGFVAPSEGRILWHGEPITRLAPGDRPLSILFQENNLFPHLSLFDNVALGIAPSLRLDATGRGRVEQALDRVGLGGLGRRKPGQLSGGQQGRAALARVLLRRRPILLLDEPFSALGPSLKTEMLDLVAEVAVQTRATVLMVTHDPADAERFASDVIAVYEGRAHPPAPTAGVLSDPPAPLRCYLGRSWRR